MSSEIHVSDILVLAGLILLAAGGWPWLGPLVLAMLGAILVGAGIWMAWPRR